MCINFSIKPYEVKGKTRFFQSINENVADFNILTIDKDSYIVNAIVETTLNFDSNISENSGCYNFQIGKYSSLAENITFLIDMNHDYKSVFQGNISEFVGRENQQRKIFRKGQVIIQNDCWIGNGATIMGGVIVHSGAIVGAGSVVTKDVPLYAIVGGNPATIIGYRFEKEIIRKLLWISWWDWDSNKILSSYDDLNGDISCFVDKYYISGKNEKLDFFSEDKKKFLFVVIDNDTVEIEKVVFNSDVYITNRLSENVFITCLADRFDKVIISGVDLPIFK